MNETDVPSSPAPSTTGRSSTRPTTAITNDVARALRNETDYDDWDYGTEPIPGDTNWAAKGCSVLWLYCHLIQLFKESESISHEHMAAIAITSVLSLPSETLLRLSQTFVP